MAWTTPMTFVSNTVLTAAQLNTNLRDNLMETEAAKAAIPGGLFISTGVNAIEERAGGSANVSTSETTTSTSYTDLTTTGPTLTVNTATRAFVFLTVAMQVDTDNVSANMTLDISGATQIAASDTGSVGIDGLTNGKTARMGICNFYDNLTPGVNVFTCKYKSASGNVATFSDRNLTIIPF